MNNITQNFTKVLSTTNSEDLQKVFTDLMRTDENLKAKYTEAQLFHMHKIIGSPNINKSAAQYVTRMYGLRQQKCMLNLFEK